MEYRTLPFAFPQCNLEHLPGHDASKITVNAMLDSTRPSGHGHALRRGKGAVFPKRFTALIHSENPNKSFSFHIELRNSLP
jgi:hypothetical protein